MYEDDKGRHNDPDANGPDHSLFYRITKCCFLLSALAYISVFLSGEFPSLPQRSRNPPSRVNRQCRFPLPKLLAHTPPHESNNEIIKASISLRNVLTDIVNRGFIDSLNVAVVTPAGTVFEKGYGVLRANETINGKRGTVDRNSIYRIASITKMFTVCETLILRERGALSWDDPVSKFLPDLKYPSYGWSEYLKGGMIPATSQRDMPRITLRQLATHMAGIGRDYPPIDIGDWPRNDMKYDPKPPQESYELILDSVSKFPLVNLPYEYPVYSNIGMSLLGLANVAANKMMNGDKAKPESHKDLLKRDIFDKIGLNSSFYEIPSDPDVKQRIAVPSEDTSWVDYTFDNSIAAAGGQYSSLGDLVAIMRTFLSPTAENGVISEHTVREWLRPLHAWQDGFHQVGAPWEIITGTNQVPLYTKSGSINGYHSQFALNPEFSYGVIVLTTGASVSTGSIVSKIVSHFQPAFAKILEQHVGERYAGAWSSNKNDTAVVTVHHGILYLDKLVIRGTDVLRLVQNPGSKSPRKARPAQLWTTGRLDEFRIAIGRPDTDPDEVGCLPSWVTIDIGLYGRGAPIDLIYWEDNTLVYPSAGVRLVRS